MLLSKIPNDGVELSWGNGYQGAFSNSNQALPLVSNAFPFQRSEFPRNETYDDYEHKSARSEDVDGRSRFTVSKFSQSRTPAFRTCSRIRTRGRLWRRRRSRVRLKRRDVKGAEGDLGLSTMGCVVPDVDVMGPHSSAHLC